MQRVTDAHQDHEFLGQIRRGLRIKQQWLAKLSGVHRSVIAEIESGRRPLTAKTGARLWNSLASFAMEQIRVLYKDSGKTPAEIIAANPKLKRLFEISLGYELGAQLCDVVGEMPHAPGATNKGFMGTVPTVQLGPEFGRLMAQSMAPVIESFNRQLAERDARIIELERELNEVKRQNVGVAEEVGITGC